MIMPMIRRYKPNETVTFVPDERCRSMDAPSGVEFTAIYQIVDLFFDGTLHRDKRIYPNDRKERFTQDLIVRYDSHEECWELLSDNSIFPDSLGKIYGANYIDLIQWLKMEQREFEPKDVAYMLIRSFGQIIPIGQNPLLDAQAVRNSEMFTDTCQWLVDEINEQRDWLIEQDNLNDAQYEALENFNDILQYMHEMTNNFDDKHTSEGIEHD